MVGPESTPFYHLEGWLIHSLHFSLKGLFFAFEPQKLGKEVRGCNEDKSYKDPDIAHASPPVYIHVYGLNRQRIGCIAGRVLRL